VCHGSGWNTATHDAHAWASANGADLYLEFYRRSAYKLQKEYPPLECPQPKADVHVETKSRRSMIPAYLAISSRRFAPALFPLPA